MNTAQRMPVVFAAHGTPMNAITDNRFRSLWRQWGQALPRPKAILAVSAHFYTRGTHVTAMERPPTIHDFYGFPQELFDVQYPAPGDPALARRVADLLAPTPVGLDMGAWGFDHGTWSVLMHMFPDADIPVVQLSMDGALPPEAHYELAKRLRPLRDEGVLIFANGNVVHNLQMLNRREDAPATDWCVRFEAVVKDMLAKGDHEGLIHYEAMGEDARLSVPTPDHYLPLLYAIAQQDAGDPVSFPITGSHLQSLSMLSCQIG
ncbi:MAG TPA: 4,5-DOPA dioxygenase extradiol [Rhodocyclaceae bacterium]|nr:4,5-DOPA dioxygenase extradiol [Rhodocyclaceae bacterium]